MGVQFSSSEAGGWSHPTSPWFPSNLCNFCQAHHSAAVIPTRAHLTDNADGQLAPSFADPVVRISRLLCCIPSPARASSHGSCPCPAQHPGLWFPCSGERWAAAHIWAAATGTNKRTKAVIQMMVLAVANRMEQSPRWPEPSPKPKPYSSLNWDIFTIKPITALCGCHRRNLSPLQVIREPNMTKVTVKPSTSLYSAREHMVWRSVKQDAPESWRWECFYHVRAPLALPVVSLRQPGSR